MLTHPTHYRLIVLGLTGMAKVLEEQCLQPDIAALAVEQRYPGLYIVIASPFRRLSCCASCADRTPQHRVRRPTSGTLRLKLLKIGAHVRFSVHRIKVAMASGCPAA
jgi:hypothetical protein